MIFAYAIAEFTDFNCNRLSLIGRKIAKRATMATSPMLGARCPVEWQQQIQASARASGRKEAEVVREAIAQYLEKARRSSVKGTIADLQERKLVGLELLVS